ncbi:hypothetical protein ACFPM3_00455 [Streptomyces coeruleoprunus]|uniref:Uncharacterized protein n=1 Tax=Streptomyces coeruleoprunus TaxID=285563 RepID=A0ABV9X586_9ACTN
MENVSLSWELYESCDIYVETDDRCALSGLLLELTESKTAREGSLIIGRVAVSVAHNDYESGGVAGFLGWGTVIECAAVPGASYEEVAGSVRRLLGFLEKHRLQAVPVCQFEEDLTM